jgi:hypothetical protein
MSKTVHTHPLPVGYVYQEYPKHRHHADLKTRRVEDPDEEADLTPDDEGWVDNLSDLEARKFIQTDTDIPKRRNGRFTKASPDTD